MSKNLIKLENQWNQSVKDVIADLIDQEDDITEIVVAYRRRGEEEVHTAWSRMLQMLGLFLIRKLDHDFWFQPDED